MSWKSSFEQLYAQIVQSKVWPANMHTSSGQKRTKMRTVNCSAEHYLYLCSTQSLYQIRYLVQIIGDKNAKGQVSINSQIPKQ